jgi:polysaccharide export outer membrane protein
MKYQPWRWLRFSLRSVLVLMLGIAIGFALNFQTVRFLLGPASEARMSPLPEYVIEPPDVLAIRADGDFSNDYPTIAGYHAVGPDGRINLGAFGQVFVSGMTIEEARQAIQDVVSRHTKWSSVSIDVQSYNSKKYYIVIQGLGKGETVQAYPITGNETVLDAIARTGGIPQFSNVDLRIARPSASGLGVQQIIPIDWKAISQTGSSMKNYQLWPGDRLLISPASTKHSN